MERRACYSVMGLVLMHEGEYRRWHPNLGPLARRLWKRGLAEALAASRWRPHMKPATSSSPTCRRFSSCTWTSAWLNSCTKSGSSAKSSLARGHAGGMADQPLMVMPCQPLAAGAPLPPCLTSRWCVKTPLVCWQLSRVCVKTAGRCMVGRLARPASSCWLHTQ